MDQKPENVILIRLPADPLSCHVEEPASEQSQLRKAEPGDGKGGKVLVMYLGASYPPLDLPVLSARKCCFWLNLVPFGVPSFVN